MSSSTATCGFHWAVRVNDELLDFWCNRPPHGDSKDHRDGLTLYDPRKQVLYTKDY